jgi:hypothetical protein
MGAAKNLYRWTGHDRACVEAARARFLAKCRFEPETGCVLWTGAKTAGRGHHVPYGSFWYDNARWFAHRWSAKHIHGFDIDGLQVDHCCPRRDLPHTLCVEHVVPVTGDYNRHLQTERRKHFIYLQVGLLQYDEVYGGSPESAPPSDSIPFYTPPTWFTPAQGPISDSPPF